MRAAPPGLDRAGDAAPVAGHGVAVFAVFREQHAVAAALGAGRPGRAFGLDLTGAGAAVERHGVAVVAPLEALLLAVAAFGGMAFSGWVSGAAPPGGPATVGRAGFLHVGDLEGRVALLSRDDHAVAADGDTGSAAQRAGVALLDLAGRRAAVVRRRVPVVALLHPLDRAVPASDLRTGAPQPRNTNTPRPLDPAIPRAPIPLRHIPVVAQLTKVDVHGAIAAAGGLRACRTGDRADPAGFERAGLAAAVAGVRVAVVAHLARFDALVPTDGRLRALHPGSTGEAERLYRAVRGAPIPVDRVAVVAHLTGVDASVSATEHPHARAGGRTGPVGLHATGAVAAIAAEGVAVVADLDSALVVDAVATARRDRQSDMARNAPVAEARRSAHACED